MYFYFNFKMTTDEERKIFIANNTIKKDNLSSVKKRKRIIRRQKKRTDIKNDFKGSSTHDLKNDFKGSSTHDLKNDFKGSSTHDLKNDFKGSSTHDLKNDFKGSSTHDLKNDFKERKPAKHFSPDSPDNNIERCINRLERKYKKNKNHNILLVSIIVTIIFLVLFSPPVQRWLRDKIPSYTLLYLVMAFIIFFSVAVSIWAVY